MSGVNPRTIVRRQVALVLVFFALVSCGGGGTGPEPIGLIVKRLRAPLAPVSVNVSAGNQQTGGAGQTLLAPIAAKVSDANGRGVPNVPVDFRVIAGGGDILTSSARTNGAGIVTATWRLGTIAGVEQRVVATLLDTLTGALVDTAQFTATVNAGAPAILEPLSGSGQIGGLGQLLPAPLRVSVRDAHGNPTPGVMVSWTVVSGSATLFTALTPADAQGVATNSLTLGQTEGNIDVRASIAGLPPASFLAVARRVSTRLTTLFGSASGIARTSSGQLLVTLIDRGQVQRVSIANPANTTLTTIGGTPVIIAADTAGQYAYATSMSNPGTLSVIAIASMAEVAEVPIPGEAHFLALSPRGDRVYVTNTTDRVFAVDIATRTIVGTTTVGPGPWGFAFWTTATDSLVYVSARNGSSIWEVDMRTAGVVRTLPVPGRPHGLAMAPDGSTLYVAEDTNGEILFVNRATGAIATRLPARGSFGIAISPDGKSLFVTTNDGYVLVVDVPSATIAKRYWTGGVPRQILVMPDGNTAMAANLNGWIDVVTR